jgi:acyl-CoA dehydrogenase
MEENQQNCAMGEMLTLIVYAELIMENCMIYRINDDLIDHMFNFMVRDFSVFAFFPWLFYGFSTSQW